MKTTDPQSSFQELRIRRPRVFWALVLLAALAIVCTVLFMVWWHGRVTSPENEKHRQAMALEAQSILAAVVAAKPQPGDAGILPKGDVIFIVTADETSLTYVLNPAYSTRDNSVQKFHYGGVAYWFLPIRIVKKDEDEKLYAELALAFATGSKYPSK